ncbi:MAG TPA: D-alanine--D-alanine ligase A, partial [Bryobacteraceae bacterium]|nr:D-alanine--D-alanine ligase A [Bryobacteraceae bacterium]
MKVKVAVLCGGRSGEHEVSLRSAESIMKALNPERYEIVRMFISKEGKWDPKPILPEP